MCFSAGSTELVSLLLEQGAIVTATDHHGSTPLHLACQKGHQSTVVRPLQTNIMQAVLHASQHNLLYMYIQPIYGYMLPNLSPSPNLYKVQSVYNNNVAS